jgi:hypothetical protein
LKFKSVFLHSKFTLWIFSWFIYVDYGSRFNNPYSYFHLSRYRKRNLNLNFMFFYIQTLEHDKTYVTLIWSNGCPRHSNCVLSGTIHHWNQHSKLWVSHSIGAQWIKTNLFSWILWSNNLLLSNDMDPWLPNRLSNSLFQCHLPNSINGPWIKKIRVLLLKQHQWLQEIVCV